ncbi:MAG: hypothetical protein ACE5JH_08285 [Acidobacteriota bacterium]
MDIFLLFAVIFVSVLFGLGVSALLLSLLFRLMLKMSGCRPAPVPVAPASVPSEAPPA